MSVGMKGILEIVRRRYREGQAGILPWRLNVDGNPIRDLEEREIPEDIPTTVYPYRSDAPELYRHIETYVKSAVREVYNNEGKAA